ncbi:MAG: T9SS type A sorting domain-containing protein, partial [bacterium]
ESAVTGFHDVSVTTGSETAMVERPGPFLVLENLEIEAAATVAAIVPNAARADTTLDVTVTGANTTFIPGVSALSFSGDGITVLSTTVVDSVTLTATIRIDSAATPGFRDVLVTTATETAVLLSGFEVQGLATGVAENDATGVPTEYTLAQNYPNPFNPETVIQYQTPRGGQVELAIFNLLGQKVRLLVNEEQPAGSYSVSWRGVDDLGNRVPSGVYVYRLTGGGVMRVKKMILLR